MTLIMSVKDMSKTFSKICQNDFNHVGQRYDFDIVLDILKLTFSLTLTDMIFRMSFRMPEFNVRIF